MAVEIRRSKDRSPNFPFITLEAALGRAAQFYAKEKRGSAPFKAAVGHWSYSPLSSGGIQTVAALKSYGLMSDDGVGAQRTVKLTDLGLRVLLDQRPDSPDRGDCLKEAATNPAVAADVYARWPDDLPSDATLHHYLVLNRAFNEETARKVIKIIHANHIFAEFNNSRSQLHAAVSGEDETSFGTGAEWESAGSGPVAPAAVPVSSAKQGEEIANVRVSKNCTIRLIATGPYSKQSIESLVAQLKLGLELGNFDDEAVEEPAN